MHLRPNYVNASSDLYVNATLSTSLDFVITSMVMALVNLLLKRSFSRRSAIVPLGDLFGTDYSWGFPCFRLALAYRECRPHLMSFVIYIFFCTFLLLSSLLSLISAFLSLFFGGGSKQSCN